jgi:hypothetical protein
MLKSYIIPITFLLLISACDAPIVKELVNTRVSSSIEMLPILSKNSQKIDQTNTLTGTWKFSKDKRQGKIPSMVFTKVPELPDYLIVPSCTSIDGDINEEFDYAYLNFQPNHQLVRIELQKKNESLCLTNFEDLDYTYNSKTKELVSFHSETPQKTQRLFVKPLKNNLIIKNNKFNGYWKTHVLITSKTINGQNYNFSHTVLSDNILDKVLDCFNVDFKEKPKNYLENVTVYDIKTYYMDNTYKVQTVYEDQISGDKCLMGQFQMEFQYKLDGSRITYLLNGSTMWSTTPTYDEEMLYL